MDKVVALHRDLKAEWEKPSPNLRKCDSLLAELKVIPQNFDVRSQDTSK